MPAGTAQASFQSDATLSCPGCFSAVCYECKRDPNAPNQWFAANVLHCTLGDPELVEMPKPKRRRRGKPGAAATTTALNATGRAWDSEELMRPIVCATCETEVGLQDRDGFYHLWGVFPSPPIKVQAQRRGGKDGARRRQAQGRTERSEK